MLPDALAWLINGAVVMSQCTYRCVVLPDWLITAVVCTIVGSQCTYRCVVLPDTFVAAHVWVWRYSLNAPTGAWCSLT